MPIHKRILLHSKIPFRNKVLKNHDAVIALLPVFVRDLTSITLPSLKKYEKATMMSTVLEDT